MSEERCPVSLPEIVARDEWRAGRQEDWEEPKGRAQAVRGAVPNFLS